MSVTGTRKRIKQGIIKVLLDWIPPECSEELASDIMAVIPKPEKCVMHKILSPANVMYFQCGKCDGIHFDIPDKFCPHCGRRVIAMEDMQLWL